jgi:hypothetical protein
MLIGEGAAMRPPKWKEQGLGREAAANAWMGFGTRLEEWAITGIGQAIILDSWNIRGSAR